MTLKKDHKDNSKLSPLAKQAESALTKVMGMITKDMAADGGRYTLADFMRVTDRALKLEAIRLSIKTDEGGAFFSSLADEDEANQEEESE